MMKKLVMLLTAFGVTLGASVAVQADPKSDLEKFRAYYKQKFPTVKFDDYAHGFYLYPGMEDYKAQWEEIMQFPPYELGLNDGIKMWNTPFKNGKTFASCFKNGGKNIAQNYPYWDKAGKKLRTAEIDLLDCMKKNEPAMAEKFKDLDKDQKARVSLANLTAAFYSLSKGQRVKPDVDFSDPAALAAYEAGKKLWWQKRGQLNFACADCHWESAGKNLGSNQPLSAALGHPVGWPAFRIIWGRLETIHLRYKTCNSQVRAKPYKHGDVRYDQIQLYETYLSSGLPLTAPAMRN
jgi:sulfur-oxidizing protein SoxA